MDRDPWGDTRRRQQETNEESEIETKKRKGDKESLGKVDRGSLGGEQRPGE